MSAKALDHLVHQRIMVHSPGMLQYIGDLRLQTRRPSDQRYHSVIIPDIFNGTPPQEKDKNRNAI